MVARLTLAKDKATDDLSMDTVSYSPQDTVLTDFLTPKDENSTASEGKSVPRDEGRKEAPV